jgi:hypothetical protein
MAGGDAEDYVERSGGISPRALVLDIEENLRALLRDVVCGFLEPDLKGAADDILLASGEPIEIHARDLRATVAGREARAAERPPEPQRAPEPEPEPVGGGPTDAAVARVAATRHIARAVPVPEVDEPLRLELRESVRRETEWREPVHREPVQHREPVHRDAPWELDEQDSGVTRSADWDMDDDAGGYAGPV